MNRTEKNPYLIGVSCYKNNKKNKKHFKEKKQHYNIILYLVTASPTLPVL
jgi:hypothetical protein